MYNYTRKLKIQVINTSLKIGRHLKGFKQQLFLFANQLAKDEIEFIDYCEDKLKNYEFPNYKKYRFPNFISHSQRVCAMFAFLYICEQFFFFQNEKTVSETD